MGKSSWRLAGNVEKRRSERPGYSARVKPVIMSNDDKFLVKCLANLVRSNPEGLCTIKAKFHVVVLSVWTHE